ncbi:hypothetical protein HBDW_13870 [Herbaspirillum sp. DW155]|uniref:hypothetical protein n=1 Tax=Herbaspirillum sp. DW155 TaxID=3095609 RepID=UPI00308E1A60|nr:hypothetical protein HBDW_13870 [Herbaspirillum sp. DW155]
MNQSLIAFYASTNLISFNALIAYLLANFMCRAFVIPWKSAGKVAIIFASFVFSIHIFVSTYFFNESALKVGMAIGFSILPYPTAALLLRARKRAHQSNDIKCRS